jgi:hypothetical protein
VTTPSTYPPNQVPFGMGGTAVQAWPGVAGASSVLFFNQDIANTVWLGYDSDLQLNATNGWPLAPLTSVNMDGRRTIYAVANPGTSNMLVMPGGTNPTLSVTALTEAFIASGLAVQIAEAIASSGISIVGAPTLLYNGSIQNTSGVTSGFGTNFGTDVPAEYGCSGGNSTAAFQCAYNTFDGLIAPQKDGASKLFQNPSQYLTTPNTKIQAAINQGHRLYLCYQPGSNQNANGTVTTISQTTSDQTKLLASVNAMIAACAAAGTGASVGGVVLYQEYNDQNSSHQISAATFQSAFNYYSNFLHAQLPGLNVYACLGSGTKNNWNLYVNAGLTFISGMGIDYYASAQIAGASLDSGNNGGAPNAGVSNNIIAIVTALNIPWSVMELGRRASSSAPLPSTAQMQTYFNYIASVIKNWLTAGHTMLDCMWFNGQANEANVILPGDPLITSPANILQNFIASITTAPITGIAANTTAVLPPLSPTPVAGYAVANGLSYDITVNLIASAGSTVPFAAVQLAWFNEDSLTAQPVSVQEWSLPAGTTATTGTFIIGAGPQRGQFLQVSITNLDTVQMSVTIQLNSTGRTVELDTWFWDVASSVAIPTFQLVNANTPYSNQIAMQSTLSIPAGGSVTRLCGMFAGEVYIKLNAATPNVITATLNPVPSQTGAANTWFGNNSMLAETLGAGEFETIIILPRCPTTITFSNSDAVARTANMQMIALR